MHRGVMSYIISKLLMLKNIFNIPPCCSEIFGRKTLTKEWKSKYGYAKIRNSLWHAAIAGMRHKSAYLIGSAQPTIPVWAISALIRFRKVIRNA
jgi:hypothetical protein